MVAAKQHKRYYTPEEYLALERAAEYKSEYFDGEIFAMSGGSPKHSIITVNVSREVSSQLKGKSCQAFSNGMKFRTGTGRKFFYPDLSVVCDEPRYHDKEQDVLLNPTIVIEILSPSTEALWRRAILGCV